MEHENAQRSIGFDLFVKETARQESNTVRIPRIPWLTSEQFKDTLWNINWPWVDGVHSDSLQFGKSIFFTGFVLSALNPSLRTDWFRVERKATKHGRLSSSHHLTHFGGDSNEEKTREDYTVPQTVHYHSHCKRCQDPEHKIKDCNSGKRSHMQSSYTVRCQQIASTEWSLKTEIEYCSEDSRPLDPRQKSPWKAIGIRSSSDSSLFVMMCRQVHGDLYGRANLGQETSAATQRMTRPVEGASCSVKSNDSKWIFE